MSKRHRLVCACRQTFLLFCLTLFLVSCVGGGYARKSRGARLAFQHGDFEQALQWYQKQKPPRRDRLLYLLDQGVILHTAGRYQESIAIFEKAITLAEKLSGPQALAKTASIISNDNLIPYKGEKFERLLISTFQVLNYLGLEKLGEAIVEVRRIHTYFSSYFRKGAKDYLRNAFATYLSGLVWEANGKVNDAYIDYKKTHSFGTIFPSLKQDLLRGARRLGFISEYARWKRKFKQSYRPLPKNHGEIILIVEEGTVPRKRSTEEEHDLQIIPIPYYSKPLTNPIQIIVKSNGKELGKSYPLYRIDKAAVKTLADQKDAIVARGIARLAAKEGVAVAVGKTVDKDLGIFLGFILLATNRADLRSWLTLPRSLQVAKFSLPKGTYDLKLIWPGGSKLFKEVSIQARRKRFITCRIF